MTPGSCTWLDIPAVAKRLGISTKSVRRLIDKGAMRHARLGRRIVVEASWADDAVIALSTPVEVKR